MANLTVTIEAETLKQARIEALERDTSVNQMVGEYLKSCVSTRAERLQALADLETMSNDKAMRHSGKRRYVREDLYLRY
jgi:hypothetical protein